VKLIALLQCGSFGSCHQGSLPFAQWCLHWRYIAFVVSTARRNLSGLHMHNCTYTVYMYSIYAYHLHTLYICSICRCIRERVTNAAQTAFGEPSASLRRWWPHSLWTAGSTTYCWTLQRNSRELDSLCDSKDFDKSRQIGRIFELVHF
jgi:hypothetical protein